MLQKSSFRSTLFLTLSLANLLLATTAFAHASTEAVLRDFAGGSDGLNPSSALIFDAEGNLYGMSWAGGTGSCGGGCGTVFELTPNGGGFTESVVYSFQGSASNDGANPVGALTADASGNFYGVTSAGGNNGCGTVFKLSPGSAGGWTESVLYRFCATGRSSDGASPTGQLRLDSSGNLYGVTQFGGRKGTGAVFELTPSSGTWTEMLLYSFPRAGTLDGDQPQGIIFDSAGNIDGVTSHGGTRFSTGVGVVFRLVQNPQGQWAEKVIHRFGISGTDLQMPTGGLVFDAAGDLYMTMGGGGRGGAGVFELSPSGGGKFTGRKLYSFAGQQLCCSLYEGLVFDTAGNLYSASYYGPQGSNGFVYKLSPGSPHWIGSKLARMHGIDGASPIGGVILDSRGNLYGATVRGGTNKGGVVFQITP